MALVTLFMTGGHTVTTEVELDCTCGCTDICEPEPVIPTVDETPPDDTGSDPVAPSDICGVDDPDGITLACVADEDCPEADSVCVDTACFCNNDVPCTDDFDCDGGSVGAFCHTDSFCRTLCGDTEPASDLP